MALLILFTSFVIQVYRNPFLPSGKIEIPLEELSQASSHSKLISQYRFDYNLLESAYLICSIFLLLSGLVFESSNIESYQNGRNLLAVLVILAIFASSILFVGIVAVELYRSIQFAKSKNKPKKSIQMTDMSQKSQIEMKDNPLSLMGLHQI